MAKETEVLSDSLESGKKRHHKDRTSPSLLSPLIETEDATTMLSTNGEVNNINGTFDTTNNGGTVNSSPFRCPRFTLESHGSTASLLTANSEPFSAANSETFSIDFYKDVDQSSCLQEQHSLANASVLSASEANNVVARHVAAPPDETASDDHKDVDQSSVRQEQPSVANSSVLSAAEASHIVERHIAAHPIETPDDFHYIAELLRNFENEEDLKRVAELLRASHEKQKEVETGPPPTTIASVTPKAAAQGVESSPLERETKDTKPKRSKNMKKKKKKKHKKSKLHYENDEDDDEDEDDDSSTTTSYSSSSASSSSSSISSTTSHKDDNEEADEESSTLTLSSSSLSSSEKRRKKRRKKRKKEKKKEKKRRKKERERIRREIERKEARKREKKAKKRAKKEEKKTKKQEKRVRSVAKGKTTSQDVAHAASLPPSISVEVHQKGNFSAQQFSVVTSDDDNDGSREVFLDEDVPRPASPPKLSTEQEAEQDAHEMFLDEPAPPRTPPTHFHYPGMIQRNNSASLRLAETPQNDVSIQPNASIVPQAPGEQPLSQLSDNESELEDSFAQAVNDEPQQQGLPENKLPDLTPLAPTRNSLLVSNLGRDSKTAGKNSSDNFEDSWAQVPSAAANRNESNYVMSNRFSTLPTIYSAVPSEEKGSEGGMSLKEYQDILGSAESFSESTPDEELVDMALKHFTLADEGDNAEDRVVSPRTDSTAYPPPGNFQFSRQISNENARTAIPLPTSKLNASLLLARQTSNSLLSTTLEMSRRKSSATVSIMSGSVLRPPSSRREDSGVVSTQDLEKLREEMARVNSDMPGLMNSMVMPGMIAEAGEEAFENLIPVVPRDVEAPEATREMIKAEFTVKPRMLCLHGWRSNAEITRLQLENLGLLDFFDPIFIEGPHVSDEPADDAVNLLSQGPYYSWVRKTRTSHPHTDADGGNLQKTSGGSLGRIKQSLYGFGSSSAKRRRESTATDELMLSLKAVMMHLLAESQYLDAFSRHHEGASSIPCYDSVYGFSQGATLVTLLSYEFVRNRVLEELNLPPMRRLPWKFVISACAANTNMKELLAKHFEIEYSVQIPLPSVHIIGLSDPRKAQSESIMKENYNTQQAFPIYLDSGHGIPASTRKLAYILDEIINWFLLKITLPDVDIANVPLDADAENVSMLHIMNEIDKIQRDQLQDYPTYFTDLDVGKIQLGNYGQYAIVSIQSSHSNLIEMLEDADPNHVAFLAPEAKPLTYGNFLKFIRGDGDLRLAGAQAGFTVAYVAPFGVVSATAFITIAAQCSAAPLDPAYNESDLLLAFEQLQPDLVITFDGIDSGPVHKVALGQGLRVAHATVIPGTCGLFKFDTDVNGSVSDLSSFLDPAKCLVNHADNNGLILRTSGTTSKPKVVPLKLWAIVANSRVIAKNLGLRHTDISLNAMPLFHIGGLSANLLSSLAAGASVILLPKFNAADFFDFLTSPEEPRPTWYSAVPTMHAAIQQFSEDSIFKTSLRFIRSGAAAMPQDLALKMEQTFNCPLILTYSMTEQMPISQPPTGYSIPRNKPNSVGQPVCASMCIVDKNLRPVPLAAPVHELMQEPISGEVCISGPMILEAYVANPDANASSFFFMGGMDWFRTGDMGHIDKDGFLFLTGRSKELIKRGGDQVSPYEVEDAIYKHSEVKTVVVFAIPDPIWGERVGAAVVLKDNIQRDQLEFKKELSKLLSEDGLQPFKIPDEVVLVTESDLPKTRSNKYIRIGLAKVLGLNSDNARIELKGMKPVNYHEAAVGVKFFLAWAVTYVHIGNFDNRDMSDYSHDTVHYAGWEHTRSWCWHNPVFFLVGGFLLAAGTHVPITTFKDLKNFYSLRIAGLHPMYLISIMFCTINFVARCRPSNYITDFDRVREPIEGQYFVCQATPIEWSYWPTLIISIISYACTLQSWPIMIPFAWFLSYYTWFSSVYIFCIFCFPWCHQQYYAVRDDIRGVWKLNFFWLAMNYLYIALLSFFFAMDSIAMQNYFAISGYLYPPGWVPCCALGVGCYHLFRHYRPNERGNAWIWGAVTDMISLLLLAGWLFYGLDPSTTIPYFAADSAIVTRHWDPFLSRILAPIGFLWFWGLAVGTGITARIFSVPFVVEWLAPASYNIFLFHQPISEWYFLATRGVWWAYPKTFFWFSSYALPVQWWEFFIVTAIVVAFSVLMEAYVNEFLVSNFATALDWLTGGGVHRKKKEGESVLNVVQSIIHELTYAEVTLETSLTEAGLSSMTTIILVSEIKKVYKTLKLTVRDVINSETVGDLVGVIEGRMKESASRPELSLGHRTGVVAPKTSNRKIQMTDESMNVRDDAIRKGGGSSAHMSFTINPSAPARRLSGVSMSEDGIDFGSSIRRRGSFASQKSSARSRHASFVVGGSGHSTNRRTSISLATNNSSFNSSTSRISRGTSSRVSLTIRAPSPNTSGSPSNHSRGQEFSSASAHSRHARPSPSSFARQPERYSSSTRFMPPS